MRIEPLGDRALTITLDDDARAAAAADAIRAAALPGVVDVVAAFDRVAVFFDDDDRRGRDASVATLRSLLSKLAVVDAPTREPIEIAVRYDGPDLDALSSTLRISRDELIARHSGAAYTVLAVGFTPGFAYLGGLPQALHAPRRPTPRPRVPAGSVAIGGPYTGVYPSETPGGWHLIGSTDVAMFDLAREEASLLRVGDRVRFVPRRGTARRQPAVVSAKSIARAASLTVLSPGAHATIQDLGRPGHRAAGVPVGGASDRTSHVVANWLVGNDAGAATLECALVGPRLRVERDAIVAICGARVAGLPFARPFRARRGDVLDLRKLEGGALAYLAIAGGFDAPRVLGSRATDARLGIGRPIAKGDALAIAGKPTRRIVLRDGWRAAVDHAWDDSPIRVLRGTDFDPAILATSFEVSSRSDRMGIRLSAASPLRTEDATRPSAPVAPGAIQLPPNGEPIVLGVDAQTIGGYAVVAHVIAADQPRLAQRRPGAAVRFVEVTLDEADGVWWRHGRDLARLRSALGMTRMAMLREGKP